MYGIEKKKKESKHTHFQLKFIKLESTKKFIKLENKCINF